MNDLTKSTQTLDRNSCKVWGVGKNSRAITKHSKCHFKDKKSRYTKTQQQSSWKNSPAQNQMSNLVEKNQINSYKFVQRTKENHVYITERKWGKLCLTK